ncbi:hypothetical protein [Accumulibacter sp.]|uniref:hypothetical protein n=1 Tax=Accumulibacter sp. TaxID=2053492 RepID=UPI00261A05B8|nr:hypothetical protein [Accumulibacter sp.]
MTLATIGEDAAAASPGATLWCLIGLAVAACAPDAWRADTPYEAALDRVQRQCGSERLGGRGVGADLIQDPYFLDLSSRFYHGEISRGDYSAALSGSYGAPADSPGVLCLVRAMTQRDLPSPSHGVD